MPVRLYLHPAVWQSWDPLPDGHQEFGEDLWVQPLEMWCDARAILEHAPPRFIRAAIVAELQRALRHRVDWLHRLYNLGRLPLRARPPQQFDLLVFLGIMRPQLADQLNAVWDTLDAEAHGGGPDLKSCAELAELTWSFLSATNGYLRRQVEAFVLVPRTDQGDRLGVAVEVFEGTRWRFNLRGVVPAALVSERHQHGWMAVAATSARRRTGALEVIGRIFGPQAVLHQLTRIYFNVMAIYGPRSGERDPRVLEFPPRRPAARSPAPAFSHGHTGGACPATGRWRTTDTCLTAAHLVRGEPLPPCPRCRAPVMWQREAEAPTRRSG